MAQEAEGEEDNRRVGWSQWAQCRSEFRKSIRAGRYPVNVPVRAPVTNAERVWHAGGIVSPVGTINQI